MNYRHKHIKNLVCSIQNATKKGFKVVEINTDTLKTKVAYYYNIDFNKEKGIWVEVEEEKQYIRYCDAKEQQPTLTACFFAFSKEQFEEGLKEHNLKKEDVFSWGAGLIGTVEGVKKFKADINSKFQFITDNCKPQDVYDYEFTNHECEYVGSDEEAYNIAVGYFGEVRAKAEIKRVKFGWCFYGLEKTAQP